MVRGHTRSQKWRRSGGASARYELAQPRPKAPSARGDVGQWPSSFFWGFSDGRGLLAAVLLWHFPFGSSSARDNRWG